MVETPLFVQSQYLFLDVELGTSPQFCEQYLQFELLMRVSMRYIIHVHFPCTHVYRTIIFLQILRLLTGFPRKLFQVNLICSINFGETLRKSNVVNSRPCVHHPAQILRGPRTIWIILDLDIRPILD